MTEARPKLAQHLPLVTTATTHYRRILAQSRAWALLGGRLPGMLSPTELALILDRRNAREHLLRVQRWWAQESDSPIPGRHGPGMEQSRSTKQRQRL